MEWHDLSSVFRGGLCLRYGQCVVAHLKQGDHPGGDCDSQGMTQSMLTWWRWSQWKWWEVVLLLTWAMWCATSDVPPPGVGGRDLYPSLQGKFVCQHSAVSHLWELYLPKKPLAPFLGAAQTNDRLMQGYKGLAPGTEHRTTLKGHSSLTAPCKFG